MKTIRLSGRGGARGVCVQLKRWLLRLTAPKLCRQIWQCADGRKIRICDMDSAHLLNTIHRLRRRDILSANRQKHGEGMRIEARRRGLPLGPDKPAWLENHNERYRERIDRALKEARESAIDREIDRLFGPVSQWMP